VASARWLRRPRSSASLNRPADSRSAGRRKALVSPGLAGAARIPLAAWWRPGGGLTPSTPAVCPLDACRPRRRRRSYRRHDFYALKTPLRALGPRLLDRRTMLGKRPTSVRVVEAGAP